jgi:transmembrane sensor
MRKGECWSLFDIGEVFPVTMDPKNYSIKDFILNESFQKWILERDEEASNSWEGWLKENPGKAEVIREARSIVLAIRKANEKQLTRQRDEVWEMIMETTHHLDGDPAIKIKEIQSK